MESKTTLVRTEGRVILDTVTAVDLEVALVVFPDNAELDNTLGDGDDLEGGAELGVLREELGVFEGAHELCYRAVRPASLTCEDVGVGEIYHCRPARTRARKEGETWS